MVLKADKTELNNYILKIGLTADLDMKNHKIANLIETPENSTDSATKIYVDNLIVPKADKTERNNFINKDGSVAMTNNVNLNLNKIIRIAPLDPSQPDTIPYDGFRHNYIQKNAAEDLNCNQKRLYNTGSYTSNNQLITGDITNLRYIIIKFLYNAHSHWFKQHAL